MKKHLFIFVLFSAFFVAGLPLVASAQVGDAVNQEEFSGEWVALNDLHSEAGMELEVFVRFVAHKLDLRILLTQQNFFQGKNVRIMGGEKTTINGQEAFWIPTQALFGVFLTTLRVHSLGLEQILSPEDGFGPINLYQVIPSSQLKERGSKVLQLDDLSDLPAGNEYHTMVLHIKYANTNFVYRAIVNLLSKPDGYAQPIDGVNAIILADYANNIRRIAWLIRLVDQEPEPRRLGHIPLIYRTVAEVLPKLETLLRARTQAQAAQAQQVNQERGAVIISDEATNIVVVEGTEKQIREVQDLVEMLDIELPEQDTRRVNVYFAKYKEAGTLVQILTNVLTELTQVQQQGQPAAARAPANAAVPQAQAENQIFTDAEGVRLVADEESNAIIVISKPSDYREIMTIVERLDISQPQVLIESVIAEVTQGDDMTYGIELATLDEPSAHARGFGITNFGLSTPVDETGTPIDAGGGTPVGRLPNVSQGITTGVFKDTYFNIPIFLNAKGSESASNVLSVPRIVTDSGQQAKILISRQVPVRERSQTGGTTGVFDNIRFEDAPISLDVTPHVSLGDKSMEGSLTGRRSSGGVRATASEESIRMELSIEVTDFIAGTGGADLPPSRTRRTLTLNITVPDNQLIILGGLSTATVSEQVTKIPLLGDIPILGDLFKTRTSIQEQRNLYIFLTPKILRRRSQIEELTKEYTQEVHNFSVGSINLRDLLNRRESDRYFIPSGDLPYQRFDLFGEGAASDR
ncbi:MAG: hypothetical protein NUW37_07250 [Planctomycetes bacterium]|nr:hypothetical protein [Planctomycetota bacterium]